GANIFAPVGRSGIRIAAPFVYGSTHSEEMVDMSDFPKDIYTEPADLDVDTLRNLGPLTGMAGIWEGTRGLDVNPKPEGPKKQAFLERIELQPIDPQANGPQVFYGLRYHTHIVKPRDVETYHDQVGYW